MTVVIPTFGRPHMLSRAIESVSAQSWSAWELRIIDDNGAGTPGQLATEQAVGPFLRDERIAYHVLDENVGACAARNEGIRQARGKFIAFLDDDDVWHRDKLEVQVERFESSPDDVAVVYGAFRRVLEDGRIVTVIPDGTAHLMPGLLLANSIGTTSLVMCRRSALLAIGGFDERLPAMQDYDLYIRLARQYRFAWTDRVLVDHLRHEEARISTSPASVIRGHRLFYDKHLPLFAQHPAIHHRRLREYALGLLRADQHRAARRMYWRAWRVAPQRLDALVLASTVHPLTVGAYRRAMGILRALRSQRTRDSDLRHET